jgi:ABC-2 type transport system ATP-binding protein
MTVLTLDSVTKSYRGRTIVDAVDAQFELGRSYAIVGPNGSGKSVLLRLMCRLIAPDRGTVTIDPRFLPGGRAAPVDFGIIIDGPAYIAHRTGRDNLTYLAGIRRLIGPEQAEEWMERVGLDPSSRERVRNYSQGMKQRLAIAQALMEDQKVLLLDEPFNALDKKATASVRTLLRERVESGCCLVFTSHYRGDVDELADEVLALEDRRLVSETPTA